MNWMNTDKASKRLKWLAGKGRWCLRPKRKNETGEPGFYKGGMISARLSVRIRGALYAQDENKKKRIKALCAQCCPSFNIGRTGENPCHELNGASPHARVIKRYLTQPKAIEAGAKMYTGSPSRP